MDFEEKNWTQTAQIHLMQDMDLWGSPCKHGMKLYQTNADECTHVLLKHHFISILYHSDMFQPSKGHPQRVQLIYFSSKVNKTSHQIKIELSEQRVVCYATAIWPFKGGYTIVTLPRTVNRIVTLWTGLVTA